MVAWVLGTALYTLPFRMAAFPGATFFVGAGSLEGCGWENLAQRRHPPVRLLLGFGLVVVGILRTLSRFFFNLLSLRIGAFRHFVLRAAAHVHHPLCLPKTSSATNWHLIAITDGIVAKRFHLRRCPIPSGMVES